MRKLLIVIIGLTAWLHPVHADVEMPADLPTIEALISLHKLMKAEEDKAMEKIAVSFGEQSVVTKGAKLFNDARTTLDSKLSNAYSYVLLAATLAATSTSLYQLIRDYAKFTGEAARTLFNAATPAGWKEAFSYNILKDGKPDSSLKQGTLTLIIPTEYQKAGRQFAIIAMDKNGKTYLLTDTDTDPGTVTVNVSFEGYAMELIYK